MSYFLEGPTIQSLIFNTSVQIVYWTFLGSRSPSKIDTNGNQFDDRTNDARMMPKSGNYGSKGMPNRSRSGQKRCQSIIRKPVRKLTPARFICRRDWRDETKWIGWERIGCKSMELAGRTKINGTNGMGPHGRN